MTTDKFIDIDNVIKTKNATLYKIIPRFFINYLKYITHQDELNEFIANNSTFYDYVFCENIIKHFNLHLEIVNDTNISHVIRPIIASNHPLGGLDGIALLANLGKYHQTKALVNDILMNIENIKSLFLPINKHGKNLKAYITTLNEAFDSDDAILLFPAGLVSRKQKGIIKDLEWKKTLIQRAKKHKRDIIPAYLSGHNSNFFYNLANIRKFLKIKANIEMLFLVDEMCKHRDSKLTIFYGKPIPYTVFDNRMDDEQWTFAVKEHVYKLSVNPEAEFGF
ncbi:MAG: glycerol acyltransferase [Bacteroidales bacterium]|nr:glycerol acyltransferase [Bacteroidales bacterium]